MAADLFVNRIACFATFAIEQLLKRRIERTKFFRVSAHSWIFIAGAQQAWPHHAVSLVEHVKHPQHVIWIVSLLTLLQ